MKNHTKLRFLSGFLPIGTFRGLRVYPFVPNVPKRIATGNFAPDGTVIT